MLAVPRKEVPVGPEWGYEFKWDGVRAIVDVAGGRARVTSRNLNELGPSYPELAALGEQVDSRVVLDGEIVALDPSDSAPSFARLQNRMHVAKPSPQLLASIPVHLYVFDVLEIEGTAVVDEPYQDRRELLADLDLDRGVVKTPPWFPDSEAGQDLLAAAREAGLEGVVSKRLASPYRPGRRSPDWIKTPLERTTEAVVVGWRPGAGRRHGMIGALVLAAHDEHHRLVHIGDVGTGFTEHALRQLADRLRPLARATSPLREPPPRGYVQDARWVEPVLVGEVAYRTLSPDRRLRHPSWRGLRPDREPRDVKLTDARPDSVG